MKGSMIEDVFDSYYDSYIDNLQDSVDVYYTCSECGKECLLIVEDDSFGYDYGSIKSTHKQPNTAAHRRSIHIRTLCTSRILTKLTNRTRLIHRTTSNRTHDKYSKNGPNEGQGGHRQHPWGMVSPSTFTSSIYVLGIQAQAWEDPRSTPPGRTAPRSTEGSGRPLPGPTAAFSGRLIARPIFSASS